MACTEPHPLTGEARTPWQIAPPRWVQWEQGSFLEGKLKCCYQRGKQDQADRCQTVARGPGDPGSRVIAGETESAAMMFSWAKKVATDRTIRVCLGAPPSCSRTPSCSGSGWVCCDPCAGLSDEHLPRAWLQVLLRANEDMRLFAPPDRLFAPPDPGLEKSTAQGAGTPELHLVPRERALDRERGRLSSTWPWHYPRGLLHPGPVPCHPEPDSLLPP